MVLRFPQHVPSFKYCLFGATRRRCLDKWENRTRRNLANSQKRRTLAKTCKKRLFNWKSRIGICGKIWQIFVMWIVSQRLTSEKILNFLPVILPGICKIMEDYPVNQGCLAINSEIQESYKQVHDFHYSGERKPYREIQNFPGFLAENSRFYRKSNVGW